MKIISLFLISGTALCFAAAPPTKGGHGIQFLPQDRKAPVDRAVDDDALKHIREATKFGGFAAEENARKGWDLESNSEFIVFNGEVTILPKGSILHIPERNRQNVISKMTGSLVLWNEFSANHRGLATNFEVTAEEASGKAAIRPERINAAKKTGQIIVATLNGNPISVSKTHQVTAITAR